MKPSFVRWVVSAFVVGMMALYFAFFERISGIWQVAIPILIVVVVVVSVRHQIRQGFDGDDEARREYDKDLEEFRRNEPNKSLDDPY